VTLFLLVLLNPLLKTPYDMETFYVYILYSAIRNQYYVGHTYDVQKRLLQHNAGQTPSTKSGRPWILVYTEAYNEKSPAAKREVEIKRMKSRVYIETLVKSAM
jgi:putative endonuclease